MRFKEQNLSFHWTQDIDTGEHTYYINSKQVEYYMLLKRVSDDAGERFEKVKGIIGISSPLFNKVNDPFLGITYNLCRLEGFGNNKQIVYNSKKSCVTDDYVVIPYTTYLITQSVAALQEEYPEYSDMPYTVFIDLIIKKNIQQAFREVCRDDKTRTRI